MANTRIRFHAAPAVTALASGLVAWGTLTGKVQEYIAFADPLNEMGFFMAVSAMAGISLMATFSREKCS